jgi:flagellar hook assembly protein FlgD
MNKKVFFIIFVTGLTTMLTSMAFSASTSTVTSTVTATVTPTPTASPAITSSYTVTPTEVIISRVKINHNRFNPMLAERVEIQYLTARHGKVSIRVFNPSGTLVRKILEDQEPGAGIPVWDGRNTQGEVVASGVYFIIVTGNKLHKRFRVAVIK